ncbi:50S ribosomal protein L7ae [Candidatus Woesearchaeota archaeon]|nr:50S ribosomal protein L7ae [Candidatus Woesearchaeota archaeon]
MSEELTKEKLDQVYEIIEVAKATGKIKKGTNEATKAAEKGTAKLVAYAKDVTPAEVVMHIPLICKDKGVPCFGVPSREELGTAAGLTVPTSAVAVTDEGNAKKLLAELNKGRSAPKAEEKAEKPAEEKKEEAPAEADEKPEEKTE